MTKVPKSVAFVGAGASALARTFSEPPPQSTLDALSTPVALLDQSGRIIGTNAAWQKVARLPGRNTAIADIGTNYLQVCEAADGDVSGAVGLRNGLSSVLAGRQRAFERTCRLLRDGSPRDFRIRVKRLDHYIPVRFLVSHEEITEFTQARYSAVEVGERILEVQAEERQRLATELHDSIGQSLVSLGLWLSRLRMVTPQTEGVATIIRDMSAALGEAQSQIRTLSYLLRPPWPEQECGLENAVRQFVQGFGQRAGLTAEVRLHGPPCRVDRSRELTLFRILQEALVNVHRHAHANGVLVVLTNHGNEVTLQVTDNGHGFPAREGAMVAPGVGILGMRTRIVHFGGELSIESRSDGTTLCVRLPTVKPS
jgi:signal transduction histidine kinase